jgi:sortase A
MQAFCYTSNKMTRKKLSLRQFNHLLTGLVIFVALYIFVTPFIPRLQLRIARAADTHHGYVYHNRLQPKAMSDTAAPVPQTDQLVIPAMELNQPIKEGQYINVLNDGGTWHRPKTSTPDKGGNTVIIAHRYTYKGLSTFYNLDQLKIGDPILIYWHGHEYDYKVSETKVLSPNTTEIEAPTSDARLTLYTCTPLWNAKNRLVIIAVPVGGIH